MHLPVVDTGGGNTTIDFSKSRSSAAVWVSLVVGKPQILMNTNPELSGETL